MKPEMRQQLAQLPFEEKIRRVSELIRVSRKVKEQRVREDAEESVSYPQSEKMPVRSQTRRGEVSSDRNPQSVNWAKNPKK